MFKLHGLMDKQMITILQPVSFSEKTDVTPTTQYMLKFDLTGSPVTLKIIARSQKT